MGCRTLWFVYLSIQPLESRTNALFTHSQNELEILPSTERYGSDNDDNLANRENGGFLLEPVKGLEPPT